MDHLWVRFSLAITSVMMFASMVAAMLIFLSPWLNPLPQQQVEQSWIEQLTPAATDQLAKFLADPEFNEIHATIYSDGYMVMDGMGSASKVDLIRQRFWNIDVSTYDASWEEEYPPSAPEDAEFPPATDDVVPSNSSIADSADAVDFPAYPQRRGRRTPGTGETGNAGEASFWIQGWLPPAQIDTFIQALPRATIIRDSDPYLAQNLAIADIYQLLREQIWQAAAVSLVLGIGLAVLLSRSLTSPLNRLNEAARAIGAKDLSRRVQVSGSKEVLTLANTFNQMAADLERAELLRRQMMADVSHELRTPLAGLESNLRAALDNVQQLDEASLAQLYSQTNHLIHLVNDLHEIALAEAGQLPLKRKPTDLVALVAETVAIFAPLAKEKHVQLEEMYADAVPMLLIDERRIRQILHNLLGNAVRHTPPGGTITSSIAPDATMCQISIRDTGEGIVAEHLPLIFERFYRADRARSRDGGGTGLGLAIARALAEAHGGTLTATSAGHGCGTIFTLSLPLGSEKSEVRSLK